MLQTMTAVMTPIVKVDVVRPGDGPALQRMFADCSQETIVHRFFAPLRQLPDRYLAGALTGPPRRHDALVLRYGDGLHVAGLASLVTEPGSGGLDAELGVLLADAWQGRGLGRALVEELLQRARERGVERVTASVLPGRTGLLRALARRLPVLATEVDAHADAHADYVTGRFALAEEGDDGEQRTST
jgi:GNAT superfamily N-acetyltransferase